MFPALAHVGSLLHQFGFGHHVLVVIMGHEQHVVVPALLLQVVDEAQFLQTKLETRLQVIELSL